VKKEIKQPQWGGKLFFNYLALGLVPSDVGLIRDRRVLEVPRVGSGIDALKTKAGI
jgi:hypothetical protein